MFDQANRSIWLEDQVWPMVREKFGISRIPREILVTVGYPSSGARGRSDKIRIAEYSEQWTGNANERGIFSIHPIAFTSPDQIVGALAFAGSKVQGGPRWGPDRAGLSKNAQGVIEFTPEAQTKVSDIVAEMGTPPSGYGVPFPVREVQRARLRKYVCSTQTCTQTDANGDCVKHPVIRAASDTLNVTCDHCQNPYVIA